MNQNNIRNVVLMAIGIVVLGGFIYYVQMISPKQDSSITTETIDVAGLISKSFTPEITQAEVGLYYNQVIKAAVATTELDVTACKPSPQIISIKKGTSISIQNNDAVIHTLAFNPEYSIGAFANTKTTVTPDFKGLTGIFQYGCDNLTPVGIIVITE